MEFKLLNGISEDNPFIETFKLSENLSEFKEMIWGDSNANVIQGKDGIISWDAPSSATTEQVE